MKKLVVVLVLLMFLFVTPAESHYLTIAKSKSHAQRDANTIGSAFGAESKISSCRRRYVHAVDCIAKYTKEDSCVYFHIIRVKYVSPRSNKLKSSFPQEIKCES